MLTRWNVVFGVALTALSSIGCAPTGGSRSSSCTTNSDCGQGYVCEHAGSKPGKADDGCAEGCAAGITQACPSFGASQVDGICETVCTYDVEEQTECLSSAPCADWQSDPDGVMTGCGFQKLSDRSGDSTSERSPSGRCVATDTGPGETPSCAQVAGTWSVSTACIGSGSATLEQSGCSFTITTSDIWAGGSGTISGNTMTFSGQVEGTDTSCTGAISGSAISGTCQPEQGSACSWSANR